MRNDRLRRRVCVSVLTMFQMLSMSMLAYCHATAVCRHLPLYVALTYSPGSSADLLAFHLCFPTGYTHMQENAS